MSHVFISYSHEDQEYAHKLAEYLEEHKFVVWIDKHIGYGKKWEREIEQAINQCAAFIVVMTPDANESTWVDNECTHANDNAKSTFPILLEGQCFLRYKALQ